MPKWWQYYSSLMGPNSFVRHLIGWLQYHLNVSFKTTIKLHVCVGPNINIKSIGSCQVEGWKSRIWLLFFVRTRCIIECECGMVCFKNGNQKGITCFKWIGLRAKYRTTILGLTINTIFTFLVFLTFFKREEEWEGGEVHRYDHLMRRKIFTSIMNKRYSFAI